MNNIIPDIGCRVQVESENGLLEATVFAVDIRRDCVSLEKVVFLKDGHQHHGIMGVQRNKIIKVIGCPKKKPSKIEETCLNKSAVSIPRKTTQAISKTKEPDSRGYLNQPTYKVPSTESAVFGGKPLSSDKEADIPSPAVSRRSSLPIDYVIIDSFSDVFYRAVAEIMKTNCVGLAMEGTDLGRNGRLGWVQLSIYRRVFLFDIIALGDDAFKEGLREIIENSAVQKVIHDCRAISDILYHQYSIIICNVFDTQVADILVYNLTHNGRLPNEVPLLTSCLFEHINLSIEQVYVQRAIESQRLSEADVWLERPADGHIIDAAVINVMYLLELRVKLIEKMLSDFTDGVDIFLGLHRDASEQRLTLLETHSYITPREFLNLSLNASESRKRSQALFKRRKQYVLYDEQDEVAEATNASPNQIYRSNSDLDNTNASVICSSSHVEMVKSPTPDCSTSGVQGWSMDFVSFSSFSSKQDVENAANRDTSELLEDQQVQPDETPTSNYDDVLLIPAGLEESYVKAEQERAKSKKSKSKVSNRNGSTANEIKRSDVWKKSGSSGSQCDVINANHSSRTSEMVSSWDSVVTSNSTISSLHESERDGTMNYAKTSIQRNGSGDCSLKSSNCGDGYGFDSIPSNGISGEASRCQGAKTKETECDVSSSVTSSAMSHRDSAKNQLKLANENFTRYSSTANVDSSYNSGSSTCDETEFVISSSGLDQDMFSVIPEQSASSRYRATSNSNTSPGYLPVRLAEVSSTGNKSTVLEGCSISNSKGFLVALPESADACRSAVIESQKRIDSKNCTVPMGRGKRIEMLLNSAVSQLPGGR